MGCWATGLLGYWAVGLSGLIDCWVLLVLLGGCSTGLLGYWVVGLLLLFAVWLLGYWANGWAGFLSCWAVGLGCWAGAVRLAGFRVYGLGLVLLRPTGELVVLGCWLLGCWLGSWFCCWVVAGFFSIVSLTCWALSGLFDLGVLDVGLLLLFAAGLLVGLGFKVWVWLLSGCWGYWLFDCWVVLVLLGARFVVGLGCS